jgi:hypothetical protein
MSKQALKEVAMKAMQVAYAGGLFALVERPLPKPQERLRAITYRSWMALYCRSAATG